ncbi:MAG TPA: hypothetical protein VKM72_34410, partial [Thermoanaerobaculia bacterium]|nr:hypothetical protein [Thermoanaerobaculia bacterium]
RQRLLHHFTLLQELSKRLFRHCLLSLELAPSVARGEKLWERGSNENTLGQMVDFHHFQAISLPPAATETGIFHHFGSNTESMKEKRSRCDTFAFAANVVGAPARSVSRRLWSLRRRLRSGARRP